MIDASKIDLFFLNLKYTPPIDIQKSTFRELLIFLAKINFALLYFGAKKFFILHLTKYYPFSLLFRENLMHPCNRKLKRFIDSMEKEINKGNKRKNEFLISGSTIDNGFYIFNSLFRNEKVKEGDLKKIEEVFKKEFRDAYVRENEGTVNILIPHENTQGKF